MTIRPMRFAAILCTPGSVGDLISQARSAADSGCDVVLLPDHLSWAAPLPSLVAVAAAVPSMRVGSCVLNTAFYQPALLARDLAAVDSAIGGRLEIGLGAGYSADEFTTAGLRFPTPAERVQVLGEHVRQIRAAFADPNYSPTPTQQAPPIMIGGSGDKVLALAARNADIVSIYSLGSETELAQRVSHIKHEAGDRVDDIELSFSFAQISLDDRSDHQILERLAPNASDSKVQAMATLLNRSIEDAAERIVRLHQQLGISYFTFTITGSRGVTWRTLAKLMDRAKELQTRTT
jgi:probable F420-dependent oxidoreductase